MAVENLGQPIGVDQPPSSGDDYPFILPTNGIETLIADLQVTFEKTHSFDRPLRLAWMYGFGEYDTYLTPEGFSYTQPDGESLYLTPTSSQSPPGYPDPVHEYDMLFVDNSNQTIVDTTTGSLAVNEIWNNRFRILEWRGSEWHVRCIIHATAELRPVIWGDLDVYWGDQPVVWGEENEFSSDFPQFLLPDDGRLNALAYYELPNRVRSLRVNNQVIDTSVVSKIILEEGYNISIDANQPVADEVLGVFQPTDIRNISQLQINASPGLGVGVFPGCNDFQPVLRTINGVGPDESGNYNFDAEGCIYFTRPVSIVNGDVRQASYSRNGYTNAQAAASLVFNNNCKSCRDCEYYARTYMGLRREWLLYKESAEIVEALRDDFRSNVERWAKEKECREKDSVHVKVSPDGDGKVSWGVLFCNSSECCVVDVKVTITWLCYKDGVLTLLPTHPYNCQDGTIRTSDANSQKPFWTGSGNDPHGTTVVANWDKSDARQTTSFTGRHCFPDSLVEENIEIQAHVTITWGTALENPDSANVCTSVALTIDEFPDDVKQMWTLNGQQPPIAAYAQKLSERVRVVPESSSCEECGCPEIPHREFGVLDLSGTCYWLDPSDPKSVTVEDNKLVEMRSKGRRQVYYTGYSPTTRPDMSVQSVNGLAVPYFDGLTTGLRSLYYDISLFDGWIAAVFAASSANQSVFATSDDFDATEILYFRSGSARFGDTAVSGLFTTNEVCIQIVEVRGMGPAVLQELFIDGISVGSETTSRSNTSISSFIGCTETQQLRLEGPLCELVIGCTRLSTTDRQKLEGYFAKKWGLRDRLPIDHPYKTKGPLT